MVSQNPFPTSSVFPSNSSQPPVSKNSNQGTTTSGGLNRVNIKNDEVPLGLSSLSSLPSQVKTQVDDVLTASDSIGDVGGVPIYQSRAITYDQDELNARLLDDCIEYVLTSCPFIQITPSAIYLLPAKIPDSAAFAKFVDMVFGVESMLGAKDWLILRGLDLQVFYKAYYENGADLPERVLLAQGIEKIDSDRRTLYRPCKVTLDKMGKPTEAVYLFEKVFLTEFVPVDIPGMPPVENEIETELDFDELIGFLWRNGIRYGINSTSLRERIVKKELGMEVVAKNLNPTPGKDASIVEARGDLRKDKSAKTLSDGKIRLDEFSVAFPKVKAGEAILKKNPMEIGKSGRNIWGEVISPASQKDLSASVSAGVGTRVENRNGVEYIVSEIDGYLTLDESGGKKVASVYDHIVHKDDVSVRKTGNLRELPVLLEIRGDVEPNRIVEGKAIKIVGAVFGKKIQSTEGDIHILGTAQGGEIDSAANVRIEKGVVSREVVIARNGTIEIPGNVEAGSVLIGKRVVVGGRATGVIIIADEIVLNEACGVELFGRAVYVKYIHDSHSKPMSIIVQVPDPSDFKARIETLESDVLGYHTKITAVQLELDECKNRVKDPASLMQFLAVMKKKKDAGIQYTSDELGKLKLATTLADTARKALTYPNTIADMLTRLEATQKEIDTLTTEFEAKKSQSIVKLTAIAGEVEVVRVSDDPEKRLLVENARSISSFIQKEPSRVRLFSGDSGSFSWSGLQQDAG